MNIYEILKNVGFIVSNDVPIGGAWLLPNGNFLDLDLNYRNGILHGGMYNTGIHSTIDNMVRSCVINEGFLHPEQSGKTNILTECCGCIKLQDGLILNFERPYMVLPKERITEQQCRQLEMWLYHIYNNAKRKYVEIFFAGKHNRTLRHIALNDTEYGNTPEEIIKEIKRFYNVSENQGYDVAIEQFMI